MSILTNPPELPKPIGEMIGEAVAATQTALLATLQAADPLIQRIHYLCAPPDEIQEVLDGMKNPQSEQYKKYPFIGLFEDITIREGREDAYYGTTTLNMVIATRTEPGYRSNQRDTITFAPILRPILREFKRQMKLSLYFAAQGPMFPMDVTERKRWGRDKITSENGKAFPDCLDAIEITNLELTLRQAPVTVPFRNF